MRAAWKSFVTVGLGLVALTGCVGGQVDEEINFLRQRPSDAPDMEALYGGRLVLSERCLHLQNEDGKLTHTAIWPFEFSLTEAGGSVQILSGDKEVVAQVGDQVLVGGGEIPPRSQEEFEQSFLGPFQCSGPYWLVTEVVEAMP